MRVQVPLSSFINNYSVKLVLPDLISNSIVKEFYGDFTTIVVGTSFYYIFKLNHRLIYYKLLECCEENNILLF